MAKNERFGPPAEPENFGFRGSWDSLCRLQDREEPGCRYLYCTSRALSGSGGGGGENDEKEGIAIFLFN